jgi:hypothetical protein
MKSFKRIGFAVIITNISALIILTLIKISTSIKHYQPRLDDGSSWQIVQAKEGTFLIKKTNKQYQIGDKLDELHEFVYVQENEYELLDNKIDKVIGDYLYFDLGQNKIKNINCLALYKKKELIDKTIRINLVYNTEQQMAACDNYDFKNALQKDLKIEAQTKLASIYKEINSGAERNYQIASSEKIVYSSTKKCRYIIDLPEMHNNQDNQKQLKVNRMLEKFFIPNEKELEMCENVLKNKENADIQIEKIRGISTQNYLSFKYKQNDYSKNILLDLSDDPKILTTKEIFHRNDLHSIRDLVAGYEPDITQERELLSRISFENNNFFFGKEYMSIDELPSFDSHDNHDNYSYEVKIPYSNFEQLNYQRSSHYGDEEYIKIRTKKCVKEGECEKFEGVVLKNGYVMASSEKDKKAGKKVHLYKLKNGVEGVFKLIEKADYIYETGNDKKNYMSAEYNKVIYFDGVNKYIAQYNENNKQLNKIQELVFFDRIFKEEIVPKEIKSEFSYFDELWIGFEKPKGFISGSNYDINVFQKGTYVYYGHEGVKKTGYEIDELNNYESQTIRNRIHMLDYKKDGINGRDVIMDADRFVLYDQNHTQSSLGRSNIKEVWELEALFISMAFRKDYVGN